MLEVQRWRESSRFDEIDRSILSLAERLTLEPWNTSPADLQRLRDLGYTDLQLLNVVLLCAYRHYATRIADGTGIELDDLLQGDRSILAAYSYQQPKAPKTPTSRSASPATEGETRSPGPWIATASDDDISESTRQVLDRWQSRLGFVPGFIRGLSLNPEALAAIEAQIDIVLFRDGELTPRWRELIARTVASATQSRYLYGAFEQVPSASNEDERQLARFAEKLTIEPSSTTAADIDSLRQLGCSDSEALDVIVEVAALNGLARIVDALGVTPDSPWRSRA